MKDVKIKVIGSTRLSHGGPKLSTMIQVTHKSTGFRVRYDGGKNQHHSKAVAMSVLRDMVDGRWE